MRLLRIAMPPRSGFPPVPRSELTVEELTYRLSHVEQYTTAAQMLLGTRPSHVVPRGARHGTSSRYRRARILDLQGAVEKLPSLAPSQPRARIRATGTEGQGGEISWGQMRGQLGGVTRQYLAKRGGRHDDCSLPTNDGDAESQPITLSLLGNKKATSGGTWQEAEGTGLEPATPYGAPHFQ